MSAIPSPILLFGDPYLCKKNISDAKKKYSDYQWVTLSATDLEMDAIRAECGSNSFLDGKKVVLIEDIPDRKQIKDFLVDLAKGLSKSEDIKLIFFDSNTHIKIDPKTDEICRSWLDFVAGIELIQGYKIIDNGNRSDEQNHRDIGDFISKCFNKNKKSINNEEIGLLIDVTGYDRGLLISEIEKLCITCPNPITSEFIVENAFPTSKESVLYKINNILDGFSYEDSVVLLKKFIESGIHQNVICEIFIRKARWQMIAAHYFLDGINEYEIPDRLMKMGTSFPLGMKTKKGVKESSEAIIEYMVKKLGFNNLVFNNKDSVKPEKLPTKYIAIQIVNNIKSIISANQKMFNSKNELLEALYFRAIKTYLFVNDKIISIRSGISCEQDLYEIVRAFSNINLV